MVANAQICPIDMHDVDISNGYALYIGGCALLNRNFENILYRVHNTLLGYLVICIETKNFPKKQLWENEFFEVWYKIDYYASVFFNCLEGKSATFYPPDQN